MLYKSVLALAALAATATPAVWGAPSFQFTPYDGKPKSLQHSSGHGERTKTRVVHIPDGVDPEDFDPDDSGSDPSGINIHGLPDDEDDDHNNGYRKSGDIWQSAKGTSGNPGCGSGLSPEKAAKLERHFKSHRVRAKSAGARAPVIIPTHFHVIAKDGTKQGGFVSYETIVRQMQILNHGFRNTGISFHLRTATWNYRASWFDQPGHDWWDNMDIQRQAKQATRQGGVETLNVWSTKSQTAGWAWLPADAAGDLDGVVVDHRFLPGGEHDIWNGMVALIHEAGHWAGLHHTFQGESCEGSGDYVSDTPRQSAATHSCSAKQSCGQTFESHNYMDYLPDHCSNTFTQGQITRMKDQLRTYRHYTNA